MTLGNNFLRRQLRKLDQRRQRVDGRRLLRRRRQDDAVPTLRVRHERVHDDTRHSVGSRLRPGLLAVSHTRFLLWRRHSGNYINILNIGVLLY